MREYFWYKGNTNIQRRRKKIRKWLAKKVIETITKIKPTPTKGESTKVYYKKLRGKFKKDLEQPGESIDKVLTQTKQLLQKVKGEKITKSGISKGKDIK